MKIQNKIETVNSAVSLFFESRQIDDFERFTIENKLESERNWIEDETVNAVKSAVSNKTLIFHTDYDADGITSAAIAKIYYPNSNIIVPERLYGYGLTEKSVMGVPRGSTLVTADCGISARDIVSQLKDRGVTVIVTDHHELTEDIPNCRIVHPKLLDAKFTGYCGAGVLYKLMSRLSRKDQNATQFAAIGTVADMVPIRDENRKIVRDGIELIRSDPHHSIRALFVAMKKQYNSATASDISFYIAPAINSCGRMNRASLALEWATATNYEDALDSAKEIASVNEERKDITKQAISGTKILYNGGVIVAMLDSKFYSLNGVVATGLVLQYKRPVIVLTENSGKINGSIRSPKWFDSIHLLNFLKGSIGAHGGGHKNAVGFYVHDTDVRDVTEKCISYSEKEFRFVGEPELSAEFGVDQGLVIDVVLELSKYRPFGVGIESPTIATVITAEKVSKIGKSKEYTKITSKGVDYLVFSELRQEVKDGDLLYVVFEIDEPYSVFSKNISVIARGVEIA